MATSVVTPPEEPTGEAVLEARDRLAGVTRRTPLQLSRWLSERAGVPVHLKLECWQRTGSFKFRGAYNAVASLPAGALARGLVTASAGNHGQALALAARLLGAGAATVFVPESAPATKKARIRSFGAALMEAGADYDAAAAAAVEHARARGAHYLHAFSDPAVVAGQGTVGLEILDSLPVVREVVVPVGGGGLIAGIGLAMATAAAPVRVLGVQSSATRAMHAAFEAGAVVPTATSATLCDGLAGEVEPVSFERARRVTEAMHLVDESEVAPAIRALYDHEGVVAEGSGVVVVAAILSGVLSLEGPAVLVVSGGNIDASTLARVLGGR